MDNSETHVTLATRYRKDNNLKKKKKMQEQEPRHTTGGEPRCSRANFIHDISDQKFVNEKTV